jgi:hypothetical protein
MLNIIINFVIDIEIDQACKGQRYGVQHNHTSLSFNSEPVLGEGFTEIVKVHFTPSFDNDHHALLYIDKSFLD